MAAEQIGPQTDFVSFSMTKIPRAIWERAKAKAHAHVPPISMRWLLICMLERYAPEEATAPPAVAPEPKPPKPPAKPRLTGAQRRKAAKKPPPVAYAPPVAEDVTVSTSGLGVPDLGDSF